MFAILVYVSAFLHAYGFLVGRATGSGFWIGGRPRSGGRTLRFVLYERRIHGVEYRSSGFQLWTQTQGDYGLIVFAVVLDSMGSGGTKNSQSRNGSRETGDQLSPEMQEDMDISKADREEALLRTRKEAKLMIWFPTGMFSPLTLSMDCF